MSRPFQPSVAQECNYYTKQDLESKLTSLYARMDEIAQAQKTHTSPQLPSETKQWIERNQSDVNRKLTNIADQLSLHLSEYEDFKNHMIEFKMALLDLFPMESENDEQPSQKQKVSETESIVQQPATPVKVHQPIAPPPIDDNPAPPFPPPPKPEPKVEPKVEHPIGSIKRLLHLGHVKQ